MNGYDEHLISEAGGDGEPRMTPKQLAIRQVWAEKQAAAHAKMIELDGGIGMLAEHHPVMAEDMHAWMDLTRNDHADTVLALVALVREQQARIERALVLARNLDRLAPGDKHYAGLIRAALEPTP